MFIVAGVINVSIATVFPQDPWGTPITFPGMMHFILSGLIGILQLTAVALMGIWLRRTGLSPRLGAYSLINAGALLLGTGAFIKMADTTYFGLAERFLIFAGLVWTFVMALWLASRNSQTQQIAG